MHVALCSYQANYHPWFSMSSKILSFFPQCLTVERKTFHHLARSRSNQQGYSISDELFNLYPDATGAGGVGMEIHPLCFKHKSMCCSSPSFPPRISMSHFKGISWACSARCIMCAYQRILNGAHTSPRSLLLAWFEDAAPWVAFRTEVWGGGLSEDLENGSFISPFEDAIQALSFSEAFPETLYESKQISENSDGGKRASVSFSSGWQCFDQMH